MPQIAVRATEAAPDEATRRALDLIERGEHFLRQPLSKRTLETALARFDEAIRVAPEMAAAYVGLGRAWLNLATGWHHEPAIAAEHAAEALRRALELDPGNAVAHALLGAIQNQFERDWGAAERQLPACRSRSRRSSRSCIRPTARTCSCARTSTAPRAS